MAEIIALQSGTVIRGGTEVFAVLRDVQKGKITLPKTPTRKTTKGQKPKPMTVTVTTPVKPRPGMSKPKQVAKPKPEAVEELKAGDWLKGLQSLTAKGKTEEATE